MFMKRVAILTKDIEYTDGKIKKGEYEILYEEGDLYRIKYGDYVVGIHKSLLNISDTQEKGEVNVGNNGKRI